VDQLTLGEVKARIRELMTVAKSCSEAGELERISAEERRIRMEIRPIGRTDGGRELIEGLAMLRALLIHERLDRLEQRLRDAVGTELLRIHNFCQTLERDNTWMPNGIREPVLRRAVQLQLEAMEEARERGEAWYWRVLHQNTPPPSRERRDDSALHKKIGPVMKYDDTF
jgi:hypothetical protein